MADNTELVTITFKIDKKTLSILDSYAHIEGVSRSEIIRKAIKEYLKNNKPRSRGFKYVILTS